MLNIIFTTDVHFYLNVLQTDIIGIQWYLDTRLQKLLQITNGLIDVNVLLDQIRGSEGLFLNTGRELGQWCE